MTTDDADRIPEPDDVEWSTSMAWNPRDDIVPFRPEESLAWRLGALRRDAAQLRQETAAQSGDNTARLRRLGLLPGHREHPHRGPGQPWRREDGTPTSSWRDIDPGTTFRDRLQENAGQEFTDRLLERYGELVRSPQFLFGPEEWAAYQQGVREDYERTTGLRWGATSANGNDVRVVASVDPAVSDPASGATAWAIPLDADGNPTGTPRTLGLVGPVTWEAEPDVRGGHL